MEQALKCSVILVTPCTSPIIGCKSFESIIGCSTCVYNCYGGNIEKPCPKCRGARGLGNSFVMRGLDDLFSAARNLNWGSSSPDAERMTES